MMHELQSISQDASLHLCMSIEGIYIFFLPRGHFIMGIAKLALLYIKLGNNPQNIIKPVESINFSSELPIQYFMFLHRVIIMHMLCG